MFAVYSVHNYYEVCVGPAFYLKRVLSAESAGGEAISPVMMKGLTGAKGGAH